MIQSLRNIKLRIKSIESTRKITHAMEMVSSAKLSRTKHRLFAQRPYFIKLETVLNKLLAGAGTPIHPLLEKRPEEKKVALCVIVSDAGLCSVYNYAIIRAAEDFIAKRGRDNVRLITIGREGFNYFKRKGFSISNQYVELHGRHSDEVSKNISDVLADMFLQKDVDGVYIAYTCFITTLRRKVMLEKFLNVEMPEGGDDTEYIVEPNIDRAIDKLMPAYISEKFNLILLDAFASEHAARMIAMKTATDNANELVETLTLLRNKARQAAITKEVLEIAMSAEALKG